jgi:hypothetical protein
MRMLRMAVVTAATGAAATAAPTAARADIAVAGDRIVVEAGDAQRTRLVVALGRAGAVTFRDAGGRRLAAGAGCASAAAVVACAAPVLTAIEVTLGARADQLFIHAPGARPFPLAISAGTGDGEDTVDVTGAAAVDLHLGPGSDAAAVASVAGPVTVRGGDGDDLLGSAGPAGAILDGGQGADRLLAGPAADVLAGGAGDDVFTPAPRFPRGLANDTVDCGPGADFVHGDRVSGRPVDCPPVPRVAARGRFSRTRVTIRVGFSEASQADLRLVGLVRARGRERTVRLARLRDGVFERGGRRRLRLRLSDRARRLLGDEQDAIRAKLLGVARTPGGDSARVDARITLRR